MRVVWAFALLVSIINGSQLFTRCLVEDNCSENLQVDLYSLIAFTPFLAISCIPDCFSFVFVALRVMKVTLNCHRSSTLTHPLSLDRCMILLSKSFPLPTGWPRMSLAKSFSLPVGWHRMFVAKTFQLHSNKQINKSEIQQQQQNLHNYLD